MRLAVALTAILVAACLSQEQLSKPRAPRRRKLMKLHKAGNTTKGIAVSGLKGDFNFQSCGSFYALSPRCRSSTHNEIQPSGAHSQLGILPGNTKDRPIR